MRERERIGIWNYSGLYGGVESHNEIQTIYHFSKCSFSGVLGPETRTKRLKKFAYSANLKVCGSKVAKTQQGQKLVDNLERKKSLIKVYEVKVQAVPKLARSVHVITAKYSASWIPGISFRV